MTLSEFRRLFERVQKLANKLTTVRSALDLEIDSRFGFSYSDFSEDEIIDCLDYGLGEIEFSKFMKLMNAEKLRRQIKEIERED